MILLSGNYEITPENLFTLSKRLLAMDAELHWLTDNELRLEHTRDDLFRVWYYGNIIGEIGAQPLNPNLSRVGVWCDPTQDNPDNKKIIQKLADSIDYNVPKVAPRDSIRDALPKKELAPIQNDWIDDLCIRWSGRRGNIRAQNMEEFLSEYSTEKYITKDQFKKMLRDAGQRGIIKKSGRRWIPAS